MHFICVYCKLRVISCCYCYFFNGFIPTLISTFILFYILFYIFFYISSFLLTSRLGSSILEGDPRKRFALEEAKPMMCFSLFTAAMSSPVLCTLTNPAKLDEELSAHAQMYFKRTVTWDKVNNVVFLPEIMRTYFADFGNSKSKVLTMVRRTKGDKVWSEEVKKAKPRLDWINFDWTPALLA